jgi:hypothetical protein
MQQEDENVVNVVNESLLIRKNYRVGVEGAEALTSTFLLLVGGAP